MFGCPTGLGAHDRVWLVIEAPPQQTSVVLNGKKLPSPTVEADYQRFQIMAQLQPRNELIIDLSHDESSSLGGLAGEVYLAIEAHDREARD